MEREREIRVMQPDCNNCRWLNLTEEEQQIVKHRSYANEHSCVYYGTRVIHRAYNHRHDPFIYPCNKCYDDKFAYYEHVLRNGTTTDREIELVNRIIKEAIVHGGDDGGPYYINENGLKSSVTAWLEEKGLTEKYVLREVVTVDGYNGILQIVKPVTENDVDLHYGGPNG